MTDPSPQPARAGAMTPIERAEHNALIRRMGMIPAAERGEWSAEAQMEYARQHAESMARGMTAYADESHMEIAGRVRMMMRESVDHEALCTAARDRIAFLVVENERLKAELAAALAREAVMNSLDICPSCYGVIGRDCWNPGECAAITQDIQRQALAAHDANASPKLTALVEAAQVFKVAWKPTMEDVVADMATAGNFPVSMTVWYEDYVRLTTALAALKDTSTQQAGEVVTCSNAAAQPTQADIEFLQRETESIRAEVHHLLDADPPRYVRPDDRAALNPSPPIQAAGVGRPTSTREFHRQVAAEVAEYFNKGRKPEHRVAADNDGPLSVADRILALLPQPDQAPSSALDTGWLIERWDSKTREFKALWWAAGHHEDDESGWVRDSLKAMRFARAEDAQRYIDDIGWSEAAPTEHRWGK
jgi:hypothetical protein